MNYESNSHKSKKEGEKKKKIEKIATGHVKKKGLIQKFADSFIQSDADNIKDYVISDVLVPSAKRAIDDVVSNGIRMILYGKNGLAKGSNKPYTMYNKCYDDRDKKETKRTTTRYSFNEVALDTRAEAEEILTALLDLVEEYGVVSVADFYDLVGVDSSYTDNNWGWTDLRTASTIRDSDGYKIKLPKAVALD